MGYIPLERAFEWHSSSAATPASRRGLLVTVTVARAGAASLFSHMRGCQSESHCLSWDSG